MAPNTFDWFCDTGDRIGPPVCGAPDGGVTVLAYSDDPGVVDPDPEIGPAVLGLDGPDPGVALGVVALVHGVVVADAGPVGVPLGVPDGLPDGDTDGGVPEGD